MEIAKIMENTKYNKYEEALKNVKKIKGFYRHVIIYFIINIILIIIWRKAIFHILNETPIDDPGFIYWMDVNILSTPILWGIGLLIHGLCVYRFKFPFFKGWEERKIKEFMNEDSSIESNKWE